MRALLILFTVKQRVTVTGRDVTLLNDHLSTVNDHLRRQRAAGFNFAIECKRLQ